MPFPSKTGTGAKSLQWVFQEGTAENTYTLANTIDFASLVMGACGAAVVVAVNAIRIFNDGTADLLVTFDGVTTHGIVRPGDPPLTYLGRRESILAVRTLVGPPNRFTNYRVEAW